MAAKIDYLKEAIKKREAANNSKFKSVFCHLNLDAISTLNRWFTRYKSDVKRKGRWLSVEQKKQLEEWGERLHTAKQGIIKSSGGLKRKRALKQQQKEIMLSASGSAPSACTLSGSVCSRLTKRKKKTVCLSDLYCYD